MTQASNENGWIIIILIFAVFWLFKRKKPKASNVGVSPVLTEATNTEQPITAPLSQNSGPAISSQSETQMEDTVGALTTITTTSNANSDFAIPQNATSQQSQASPNVNNDSNKNVDQILESVVASLDKVSEGSSAQQEDASVENVIEARAREYSVGTPSSQKTYEDRKWLSKGESITINDVTIGDGLIYVGNAFGSDWHTEPSCIIPTHQVKKSTIEQKRNSLGYYPSYDQITPIQRYVYLKWLADGRKDPEVDIGYVFIYFYGLERRIVVDTKPSRKPSSEVSSIIEEVKRLLTLYSSSRSFHNYANEFLNFIYLKCDEDQINYDPNSITKSNIIPISISTELAKLAKINAPLPSELALNWYLHSKLASTSTITEYSLCKDEYKKIFKQAYEKKFSQGIPLIISKSRLKLEYRPANNSLYYADKTIESYHFEVAHESSILKKIETLYERCDEGLGAYRRFITRKPEERGSVNALSLLPDELLHGAQNKIVNSILSWTSTKFTNVTFESVSTAELFQVLQLELSDKISKAESIAVVQFLAKLKIGIEPDIRFTGHRLLQIENVVLYQLDDKAESTPTENFSFAILFLELAFEISDSDNVAADIEKTHLQNWINSVKEFSKTEKKRLHAHLEWLFVEKPELSSIKKKITTLSNDQKEAFLNVLIQVANIDGKVEPEEIKMLQKVYVWMGIDKERLFSDIHSYQSSDFKHEPVTILKGGKSKKDYAIPEKPVESGIVLNQSRIDKKIKETKKVNAILSEVFAEEESDKLKYQSKEQQKIKGLDALHTELVFELVKRPKWIKSDFEDLCKSKGLFTDGAMEMINEAAYGLANEPLLEEDDEITVISDVAKAMKIL